METSALETPAAAATSAIVGGVTPATDLAISRLSTLT
jgi:hypothetical protein